MNYTHTELPCGCSVSGWGTDLDPVRPVLCERHLGLEATVAGLRTMLRELVLAEDGMSYGGDELWERVRKALESSNG